MKITLKDIVLIFITIVIVAILMPISNIITQSIINTFSSFSEKFSRFYYLLLSINNPNNLIQLITFICIIILGFLLLSIYTYGKNRTTRVFNDIIASKKTFNTKDLNPEINSNNVNEIYEEILKAEKSFPNILRMMLMVKISMFIIIIFFYSQFLFFTNIESVNTRFNNDLTIIAPYVDSNKILELKSDWVLMSEKKDFENIYKELGEIVNQRKKELKKLNN